jgi:hypothetical protein
MAKISDKTFKLTKTPGMRTRLREWITKISLNREFERMKHKN